MPLSSLPFTALLDALSAPEPTPGGGSAAALGGALGAALLLMVARLPKTRSGGPDEAQALTAAAAPLASLRDRLAALADEDTAAYDAVTAAYRRPKGTGQENAARSDAIAAALRRATDVPLQTMRACADVLELAVIVARNGHRPASSDAAVGLDLVLAALRGAERNVRVNLASLSADDYRARATGAAADLLARGATRAAEAGALLA